MSDFAHRHTLRVYYEDTDAGGIVYHAAYLRFAERARTEALRDMGLPHARMQQEHGCFLVVKRAALEYERPARLDDSLVVITRIRRAAASLLLDQQAWRGEERLVRIGVKLACVDQATLSARRLPEPWLGALRARISDAEGGLAP